MKISLGEDPWILILLSLFEVLFILIPAFIASKVEKTSFTEELKAMGFRESQDSVIQKLSHISNGLAIGAFLFFSGRYIYQFFRILTELIFGSTFISEGERSRISTTPNQPNLLQLLILMLIQLTVVAISEEAFFRSFVIQKFNNIFRPYVSIAISSLLFSLYHVPPFIVPLSTVITYFGYYFTIGVVLALLFIWSNKNLLSVVICHGWFNILVLLW